MKITLAKICLGTAMALLFGTTVLKAYGPVQAKVLLIFIIK